MPKHRVLLALEGSGVNREVLNAALGHCVHLKRLDILVVNPPREPTFLLGLLLIKLEHSGVDYRLLSPYGSLADEVLRYMGRYPRQTSVIVIELAALKRQMGARFDELAAEGHQFLELLPPGQ